MSGGYFRRCGFARPKYGCWSGFTWRWREGQNSSRWILASTVTATISGSVAIWRWKSCGKSSSRFASKIYYSHSWSCIGRNNEPRKRYLNSMGKSFSSRRKYATGLIFAGSAVTSSWTNSFEWWLSTGESLSYLGIMRMIKSWSNGWIILIGNCVRNS